MKKKLKEKISKLPKKPGVYFLKNNKDEVVYIGKSVDLKKRVKSYFQKKSLPELTARMVSKICDVEVKVCASEFEALLLESQLIRRLQPYFNVRFKDDKHFLMIAVFKEDYPRVYTTRKKDEQAHLFGPFPSSSDVRRVLKTIRRIFPYCSCKPQIRGQKRACLYYYLGLCPGCCIGLDKKTYKKTIKKIIKFLKGDIKGVKLQLKKEMELASKNLNFELAGKLKKQLEAVDYVVLNWQNLDEASLTNVLPKDRKNKIMLELKKLFPDIKSVKRIEAYDVSNLYGQQAAGSLVVFENFSPSKKDYRRFKIRSRQSPDDVGMLKEVFKRRLKHKKWDYPQLMIIDGGKGQAITAFEVLKEKNLLQDIKVLGLAKKEETIFKPEIKKDMVFSWKEIKLSKASNLLKMLQALRDESHRFAKNYHLLLRKKKFNLLK